MALFETADMTQQLLPLILDRRAASDPNRVWAKFPVSPASYEQGFRAATYGQMRNAVNRMAWMLEETIGTSTQFDTLAYLGPGDLRYHIVLLAAIKTGYKAFFPSPRNSTVAQKDLLSRLQCRVLLTTDPEPPFVEGILREYAIQTLHIPSLDALLQSEGTRVYPYEKSFDEVRSDPILVLHTSGSTGIPKPMVYTHEFAWRIFKANTLPAPEGMMRIDDRFLQGEFFSFLPSFHIAGIGWGLVLPMFANSVPVLPLTGRPPSTDSFLEAVKFGSFDWAFLLPVIIDELSKDPESLDLLATKLKYIFYTGGALPQGAGNLVSAKIPVFSGLGSSECAAFPQIQIPDESFTETWKYINFNPAVQAKFQHHMDDLYELVVMKSTDHPESQPVFAMFPHLDEYETRDLFSPHPSIPGLWRHRGRRDDIVVLLNGEKTNPVSFEEHISRHPAVRAALVAGNQRFEACLLVEPAITDTLSNTFKANFIEEIWPTVEEANGQCPAHARISKSKILVVDPEKPMLRAGKGTVQREGTLRLYSDQIDALYSEISMQPTLSERISALISNSDDAVSFLRTRVAEITSWSQFENDANFFELGMDSLQALRLSGAIRSILGMSSVSPSVIYKNPSIQHLAKHICPEDATAMVEQDRAAKMTRILRHYEQEMDKLASDEHIRIVERYTDAVDSQVVVLTGSTGAVGSFVLNQLLSNPKVSHIYCLNRAQDSEFLQVARNRQRGLRCDFAPDRVTFLTADLSKERLALDSAVFGALVEQTTQIIHNAWPVDFNQPVEFFQSSLDGLLGLIAFATQAKLGPSLLFLSSISAVSSYNQVPGAGILVPEEIILSLACPASMGYGESKYLAERILGYAAAKLSIRCGVSRIGQVAGTAQDPRGWNWAEWLPSLILSSRYLKSVPISLAGSLMDLIDWVPLDELASVLVELSSNLAVSSPTTEAQIFHCVNPQTVTWADLLPVIVKELEAPLTSDGTKAAVVTVGFREWLDKLEASATALVEAESLDTDIRQNPAIKLIDFYEQLLIDSQGSAPVRLSTDKSVTVSETLRHLQPIQPDWLRGWIQEWTRD